MSTCLWVCDDDGIYATACGEMFEFTADGPDENCFRFCPYCGQRLISTHDPYWIPTQRKTMKEYKAEDGSAIYVLSDGTVKTDREEALIAQKLLDGNNDIERFLDHMDYQGKGQRTRAERVVRDYVEWSAKQGIDDADDDILDTVLAA